MTGADVRDDLLDEADAMLRAVRLRYDDERIALWRWRARLMLRRSSALALAVIAREGLLLADLMSDMWPREDWPNLPISHPRPLLLEGLLRGGRKGFRFGGSLEDRAFERRHSHEGCVVRRPSHSSGRLGFSIVGGELTMCVDLGPCRLAVCGSKAMLRLPPNLPDAVLSSCVGRSLKEIVEHPLFDEGDHVVSSVRSSLGRSNGVICFRDEIVALEPRDVGIGELETVSLEQVELLNHRATGVSTVYCAYPPENLGSGLL